MKEEKMELFEIAGEISKFIKHLDNPCNPYISLHLDEVLHTKWHSAIPRKEYGVIRDNKTLMAIKDVLVKRLDEINNEIENL